MEKIHILTDSSSDIPQGLVEQHGIEIVPIMLSHGGRTFREYYDITPAECCRLLEESDEIDPLAGRPCAAEGPDARLCRCKKRKG